jgi:hypothetical protein
MEIAANILDKESWIVSSLGLEMELTAPHHINTVFYKMLHGALDLDGLFGTT